MKKFSDFKNFKKIYEQEVTLSNGQEQLNNNQSIGNTHSIQDNQEQNQEQNQDNVETINKSDISKFVSKIFESRQMAHVFHLQTKGNGSYAQHKALEKYYEGILDFIDDLVEVYSGQYEIIENYEHIDTSDSINRDKLKYFVELADFIKNNRFVSISKEDTHLQNIIDEIVALIYKTLYKLKNLQ